MRRRLGPAGPGRPPVTAPASAVGASRRSGDPGSRVHTPTRAPGRRGEACPRRHREPARRRHADVRARKTRAGWSRRPDRRVHDVARARVTASRGRARGATSTSGHGAARARATASRRRTRQGDVDQAGHADACARQTWAVERTTTQPPGHSGRHARRRRAPGRCPRRRSHRRRPRRLSGRALTTKPPAGRLPRRRLRSWAGAACARRHPVAAACSAGSCRLFDQAAQSDA